MKGFWEGFEKRAKLGKRERNALFGALSLAGVAGGTAGGLGALIGHGAHVDKKLEHARHGKKYKEETFVEKHPKATGAASLGLIPAYSSFMTSRELDRENPLVRKVMKEHPFMTLGL